MELTDDDRIAQIVASADAALWIALAAVVCRGTGDPLATVGSIRVALMPALRAQDLSPAQEDLALRLTEAPLSVLESVLRSDDGFPSPRRH